jgi:hypothetical protein
MAGMAWNLSVNFTIPNGQRLEYPKFKWDEENKVLSFDVELRMSAGNGSRVITRVPMEIRDGDSDQLTRQASPAAGINIDDPAGYFVKTKRATPTGYTDAINAWRAANATNTRRSALEAHLSSAGHIDNVSLAGS